MLSMLQQAPQVQPNYTERYVAFHGNVEWQLTGLQVVCED